MVNITYTIGLILQKEVFHTTFPNIRYHVTADELSGVVLCSRAIPISCNYEYSNSGLTNLWCMTAPCKISLSDSLLYSIYFHLISVNRKIKVITIFSKLKKAFQYPRYHPLPFCNVHTVMTAVNSHTGASIKEPKIV